MQWQGEAPAAPNSLEGLSYRMAGAVPVYCLHPRKTRKTPSLIRGAVSSSALLQLLSGWGARAAQEPLGCLKQILLWVSVLAALGSTEKKPKNNHPMSRI